MASSGSAQRAFVGRRNKMTAADVRRHLMTGSLITHPAAQSIDSAATSSTMISLLEVVDPVDVEDTLSQRKASSLIDMSCGALSPRKVSEFPADDVEVRIVSRESQTVDPPVTCDLNSDEVDPHVRDIMSSLCDQFSLMQRRYQQFGTGDAYVRMLIERPIVARSAPLQVYENDVPNADRITRSASIVETDESKRNSFASTVSSSTMASSDTTALEPRLHQSQPDPTFPYVIQRLTPQQMDNTNETKRQAGRQPYVVNLLPPQLDSDVIEKRSAPPFPEERITHKLIIKVVKLHMEPFFEPIFGAIALYDAKARRKVTENFYFDLNPSAIHELISPSQPAGVRFGDAEEALERCSQAAFHLSVPLHDLFIVVKLEKVLQACDVFDASEPYVSSSRDEKIRERLASVARTNCSRLGKYRMPLGFLVIDLWRTLCDRDGIDSLERVEARSTDTPIDFAPLASGETDSIVSADRISVSTTSTFRRIGSGTSASTVLTRVRTPLQRRKFLGSTDDEKNMENQSTRSEPSLANLQPFHRTYTHFYRQESERITEDELLKLLADARKAGSKLSKMKTFPAVLTLQFSGVSGEELLTRLTPDMLRVAPFVAGPGAELTKDVLEFPSNFHYAVNVGFRNLLYLYPKSMNFAGRPGTARNIVLKVELMDGKEEPQKLLFCKGADVRMDTALFTSVIYHNKSPQLGDEIKLRIPEDLNDGHHLLFTFYHISCKTQTDDPVEFPIGYTWIPLCRDGRLSSGDFALPVSMDKLPQCYGYLSPEVALPNVRWIEQHKPLFSVSLLAASSVHTQDEHLERFVLAVNSLSSSDPKKPPVGESQLIATIQGVIKARPEPMIAFLYSILDKLIYLIANPPYSGNVSIVCFETLCQLVKICTLLLDSFCDRHGRSSLLTTYIHYFKIALKEGRSHSPMCKQLMESGIRQPGSPETQKLFHIIEGMERSVISQKSKHRAQESSIAATTNNRCLHEELLDLWVRCMGSTREMAFINAWFFLELLIKSMAEYLSMTGRLYLHRRSRFSDRFVGSVDLLSAAVCEHVISRVNQHHQQALSLATSWAFFLRDALSLMDRSYILGLVRDFNRLLAAKISASTDATSAVLLAIKLDFTRVVCSHEHYVILNLPFGVTASSSSSCSAPVASSALPQAWSAASASTPSLHPPSPGGSSLSSRGSSSLAGDSTSSCLSGLSPAFRSLHFLIGLVLSDLASVLETCQSRIIHAKSIGVVRNLLAAHEADSRLADPAVRARIAALYVPLIDIILDAASQLHEPNAGREHLRQSRFLDVEGGEKVSVAPQVALAIAGIGSTSQAVGDRALVRSETLDARKTSLSVQHTRQLLSCLCWVLKNMERSALRAFLREQPPARFSLLMGVLQVCVSNFEYKTVTLDLLEAVSMEGSRVENAVASCVGEKYGVRMRRHHSGESKGPESDERVLQTVLCSEAALCVLDTLEMAIRVVCLNGSDHLLFALPLILRTLMHMLSCNQSVQTLEHIFATQRAFVSKFPELVFEQETEQCGELCLQLLRHCASRLPAVRSQAAASLYLLMREAYESGGSLARVKMQITMSLSTLVSNGTRLGVWLNEDCLRRSLKTVLLYADHDQSDPLMRTGTNFSEQVKDLVFNLHMILSDTVKMKEFANDFHMTIDLMYRVAKGYQNNPDLRVTWLLNMASRQADAGLYAEAGLCVLHAAALAAEYLAMTHTEEHFPRGAVDFESLSENILEESAVSDDVVSPEMEGICESRHFTEDGLVHLVERGAAFLERAHMFEALPDVYKIIEPIVREWRDYARLSAMHARLSACLAKIEPVVAVVDHAADMWPSPLSSADKRCFGTYFRVGFYGSRFSDLDGEEFIYKEPPFTKLSEISSRLEGFYSDRFGAGVVEVIKDSNNVVRSSHHANKAYLQITYVEPYFDKWEQRRRPTHYERSHNIKRFVFATPFTRDGKAHGDLKDQYKRRTILATQHAFPYVKSRIRVVEREQRVLTPIEVAIEDVERKNRELCAAMAQNPPDAKMLQMVVQGCIGTQVNQGPLQVAHVFLADVTLDERGKPVDRLQNKLRLCFKDFSKKCADALALNKQLIQADQHAYQNELQKNYDDFSRQIAVILGIQNGASENKRHDQRDANRAEEALAFAAQLGPVTEV